jgi:hypothetical protein
MATLGSLPLGAVPYGGGAHATSVGSRYRDFLRSLFPDSHDVSAPVYSAVLGAIGSVLDQFDPFQIGLPQEFSVTTATGSALDRHGLDWGVYRHAGESDDAYRSRILAMLPVYANGATNTGISGIVAAFTGAAPQLLDCSSEGWVWTESAWLDSAWADRDSLFTLYVFVNNPNSVDYNHFDMEFVLRRALPARSRIILWHNGTDTSTLGEAADARIVITG